jgi:hypothetical protein
MLMKMKRMKVEMNWKREENFFVLKSDEILLKFKAYFTIKKLKAFPAKIPNGSRQIQILLHIRAFSIGQPSMFFSHL